MTKIVIAIDAKTGDTLVIVNEIIVFRHEDSSKAFQWALKHYKDTSFQLGDHVWIKGKTHRGIEMTKKSWWRICSKCNGIGYKGELKRIGHCRTDSTVFFEHVSNELCKERGDKVVRKR
jgi:hypothetical protein